MRDRDGGEGAGRLRLGQVLQRGGLSVPEAGAPGLRHQQRRPLHPAVPRLVGGGTDGDHRLRRGDRALHRGQGFRRASSSSAPTRPRTTRSPPPIFKQAAKRGAKLIVMDPRGQALKRHATHMLQFKPGTDVALLNAMMNVIVEEELVRPAVHPGAHRGLRGAQDAHQGRSSRPRRWRRVCGIDADTMRTVARTYARRRTRRSSSGAWASPSTCTAPTTRAA